MIQPPFATCELYKLPVCRDEEMTKWKSDLSVEIIGNENPPESVSIAHAPTLVQQAKAFADRYAREQPAYTASFGGHDAVAHQWLDSYTLHIRPALGLWTAVLPILPCRTMTDAARVPATI
jgi:hypothetical protein